MKHTNKVTKRKLLLTAAAALITVAGTCGIYMAAESAAGASVKVSAIDYDNFTMTVTANSDDHRVYFATSKTATTWEKIPGDLNSKQQITMDISWVSVSKNTTLYLKGDKSDQLCEVTLPKQNTAFKATFSPEDNTVKFVNQGDATDIYWRKSTTTTWQKYSDSDETKALLDSFCAKGISLYFRTGQVAGTSADSVGIRPSKTVTVKITKRAAAPKITLDYSKLTFGSVKKTMEYKPSNSTTWTSIDSTTLKLSDALPSAMAGSSSSDSEVSIDFRIKATATKPASLTYTIKVPVQKAIPDNVQLIYTGSKQCKIMIEEKKSGTDTIPAASAANPYEYTVITDGSSLDAATAKWTTIKTSATTLSSTTAPKGSTIYVRKKATTTAISSSEKSITISGYPDADSLNKLNVAIKKVQGVELENETFSITAIGSDTTVSSITCNGTAVTFDATSTPNGSDKSTISVTITNVDKAESKTDNLGKTNNLLITLSNGDQIAEGITLYIQKAATIEAASYIKYVGIPFTSDANGNITFNVALNDTAKNAVTVDSITYNGNTLKTNQADTADNDYIVGTVTNNTIPVTIYRQTIEDKLPGYMTKANYGTAFSFVVTLSNKEALSQVTAKVAYPVTVSASSSSVGISQSGYTAALNASESGTLTGTYADPVISYTLNSNAANGNNYEIVSLTWNGEDVLGGYTKTGSTWQVILSLSKLVRLPVGNGELTVTLMNTDSSTYETLIVDYGYYITLIQ